MFIIYTSNANFQPFTVSYPNCKKPTYARLSFPNWVWINNSVTFRQGSNFTVMGVDIHATL